MGCQYESNGTGSQGSFLMDKYFLSSTFSIQLPDQYGAIRTLTTGKGSMVIVGTTKNCILQGTMSLTFSLVAQVSCTEMLTSRKS